VPFACFLFGRRNPEIEQALNKASAARFGERPGGVAYDTERPSRSLQRLLNGWGSTDAGLPRSTRTVKAEGQPSWLFAAKGVPSMCDYSLHHVASRPAKAGDKVVTTRFTSSTTRGFAPVGEPNVAVCLLPGTEVAFEKNVECHPALGFFPNRKLGQRVARFRQVNVNHPNVHHDALEFPNGQVVLLTRLCEGQHATVLQLPASARPAREATEPHRTIDTPQPSGTLMA